MGCTCGGSPSNRVTTCAHTTDNGLVLGGGSPSDRVPTYEHTTDNGLVLGGGSPSDRVPTYEHTTVNGLVLGGSPITLALWGALAVARRVIRLPAVMCPMLSPIVLASCSEFYRGLHNPQIYSTFALQSRDNDEGV